ncbi:MAG: penicillin-binding protein 2 [Acidimicrobiia bacterium]
MPRHDATKRVVEQSLFDIENDIKPHIKHRPKSKTRYTTLSVKSSNVSPLKRNNYQRPKTTQRSTSAPKQKRADVIPLHSRRKPTVQRKQMVNHVAWNPRKRATIIAGILLIPFLAIILKLVDIQILNANKYSTLGVAQRRLVRTIIPDRGTITDRNGNLLAVSKPAYSVVADPSLIKNDSTIIDKLSKVVVFDSEKVKPLLRNKKSRYALITQHVDQATAKRVTNAQIPGISIIKDPKRTYPSSEIASSVVGFVGNDMNGLGGLEYMLDKQLKGKSGEEIVERDPKGREIPNAKRNVKSATRGDDVTLTLDESIQYEAQRVVLEEVAATKSKGGTAIVADVKTGEILAMVSVVGGPDKPIIAPATDKNHAVTDVYEPGSTNKVITISGALESKVISPSTTFSVPDKITFDNKDFVDHDPHEPMTWNAADILRESSNVGTIMISNQLKKKRLDSYLRAYGFGKKTALNFPGEASGILLDPKDWSDTSVATVPIGNGLAVTPMQMLSVYMTVANDGVKVDPKLIKSFTKPDGTIENYKTSAPTRVISSTTSTQVRNMLKGAVEKGTGKLAVVPGYSVGGKTGTARKPPYNKPPYKYMASFAGFAPVDNPRLAAIVILDEPQGQIFGGQVAAPVFSRVMQSALRVRGITPDQQVQGQSLTNEPSVTTTTTTTTLPVQNIKIP